MGQAFLHGNSGDGRKLPVLNESYPENITVTAGGYATFTVLLEEEGKPADYTYTWYVNGSVVEGAKSQNYIRDTSEDKGVLTVYCEVTNKAGTVTSRVASLTIQHNLTVCSNAGATVTATKDEETVSGTCDASGSVTLALTDGTWRISATDGEYTKFSEVSMDGEDETVDLTLILYLYNRGDMCGEASGGWNSVFQSKQVGNSLNSWAAREINGDNIHTSFHRVTDDYHNYSLYFTGKEIDLSGFTKLNIVAKSSTKFSGIGVSSTTDREGLIAGICVNGGEKTYQLDINSIDSGYVYFGSDSSYVFDGSSAPNGCDGDMYTYEIYVT